MIRALHLTTHLNTGGITTYINRLIEPLRRLDVEIQVLSSGGEITPEFVKRGAKIHELPIRTKSELHPKLYFAIPKIVKIIRREKIDLLHAHTRVTQVMSFWIQRLTGIPVVTTCHGFYKARIGRKLLPAWGDRAIAISDGVAESLVDLFGIPKSRISNIYNAVDIDDLDLAYHKHDSEQIRKNYGFKPKDPVLGVIARLVQDKGHEYLIRAIPGLQKRFPNIRVLIVGEGRQRMHLEALSKELGIQNHVIFTGNLTDITYAMAAMDIFVLPATWREGFGLSIIEAMTCGKPVVVTNIWALNTLIQNRITGLMIEPSQTEPIIQAVTELLTDSALKDRLIVAGREMVEKLFSIHRMAREIQALYQSVLVSRTQA
ncbi:MAG: glycosyltransferase family 1 protein [Candidatus Omnitrophica bacterium]|nr:glycosyltransferase family 1 protein [Candidatus Omnitrophota bacterium]